MMRVGPVLAAMALAALLLAPAVPGPARAAPACGAEETQAGMNACLARQLGEADLALNAAYRALIARLGADSPLRAPLTEAQRAWLRFRDAECAFAAAGSRGGSFHPAAQSGCLMGLTRQRLEALQAYLDCAEGDLACPVPPAGR